MPHGPHIYSKASNMAKATMCAYPYSDNHFHTGNFYCDGVLTAHVSIFLNKKYIFSIHTQHLQLGFTFITSLRILLIMVELYWKTIKYITCETRIFIRQIYKNIHQKIICYDGDNNFWFSYQFLYTRHPKFGLSPTTCAHNWTNHCGEMRRTSFQSCELFQSVLCRRDYSER